MQHLKSFTTRSLKDDNIAKTKLLHFILRQKLLRCVMLTHCDHRTELHDGLQLWRYTTSKMFHGNEHKFEVLCTTFIK